MSALCSLKFSGSFPGSQWFLNQEAVAANLSLKLGGNLSCQAGTEPGNWSRSLLSTPGGPLLQASPYCGVYFHGSYLGWPLQCCENPIFFVLSTLTQECKGGSFQGSQRPPVGRQLCSPLYHQCEQDSS